MKQGDRIAIKATYTRKNDVPFENRGRPVSAMRIKAIGTITGNPGDGKTVDVAWEEVDPPREWFFYTCRTTVARARFEDDDMARRTARQMRLRSSPMASTTSLPRAGSCRVARSRN